MIDSILWCNAGILFQRVASPSFEPWGPFKVDNSRAACEQKGYSVIAVTLCRICYTNKADKP